MIKLYDGGVYLVNGTEVVPEAEAAKVETLTGKSPNKEEAKTGTIAYGILKEHNQADTMDQLRIKFDAMASHDITFVGIVQTAKASGMEKFPLPYVLTNCHNTLCAVGGTINEDDHMFGLSAAKKYGGVVREVLRSYLPGRRQEVTMHPNGLLWAQLDGWALSWMNAYVDGHPVTERAGYQVETNALWYNSICFAVEMEHQDEQHDGEDKHHLLHAHPQVPFHGDELAEVYLAKGDKEDEKHEQRQYGIADGGKPTGNGVQSRSVGEYQIDHSSHSHGYGEGPVADEFENLIQFTLRDYTWVRGLSLSTSR